VVHSYKMKKLQCVTEPALQKLIEKTAKRLGKSHAELANEHGVLPQRISAFLRGIETAGNQIPQMFDLEPIVVFVPKGHELEVKRIRAKRGPAAKPEPRKSKKSKEKGKKKDKRSRAA
jgi:hypothetical protein